MAEKFRFRDAINDSPIVTQTHEAVENDAQEQSRVEVDNNTPEDQSEPAETKNEPSPTVESDGNQGATQGDLLRDEWMQFLKEYDGNFEIGYLAKVPDELDERMDNIMRRMRGVPGAVKMPKKNLVLLALWEFVEKYEPKMK